MTDSEVVVIGGGPAGALCAHGLARRGIAVTVVERARFPRTKVCGEYLNAGALRLLDDVGLGDGVRARSIELAGIRLVPPGLDPLELDFPAPARSLARADLDAFLLEAARAAGARIVRARAEDLIFAAGRVAGARVRDPAGEVREVRARFVVGADGSGSLVARKLGLLREPRGAPRFALGGHYRGFGDLGKRVEMYVGGGAYFALNPLGGDLANVMVVVRQAQLAGWSAAVDAGMRGKAAELARGVRGVDAAVRVGPRVSIGPLAFDVSAAAAPGALLAGDASGFLNPFTGQGVYMAIRGGIDAAATLAAALADPAREARYCAAYAARRARLLAARRRLGRAVDLMLDVPFVAARVAGRLRSVPELGRTLLDAIGGTAPPERALSPLALGRLLF
jgi:2-polyprenyl-6-methoxyphenol hydroxylase-like FAD-dependent oxidoreductase